jgi:ABC-2 type transport system permease protein
MIRALLFRSLRQHIPLLAGVGVGLFLFELLIVWVATRIDTGPGLRQFLETFLPPDVREIIFGQLGLASFGGAVSFGYQHPFVLVAAVGAVIVLATTPAAERESGFLDLILARPVSRQRYLAANELLLLMTAVLLPLLLLAGAATGLEVVEPPEPIPWTRYIPATIAFGLFLLAVAGYALLFSTHVRRRGTAVARAAALTLGFYWLDFMGSYWDALATARYLSPFLYFDPTGASGAAGLALRDVVVLSGIWLLATTAAFAVFRRADP